jgi:hypothetical protein
MGKAANPLHLIHSENVREFLCSARLPCRIAQRPANGRSAQETGADMVTVLRMVRARS